MINSIHIRNFKSLRNFSIQLDRRNVFVGPNMAGKTNIIDVFRFLSQMVIPSSSMSGIANAFNARNGFSEVCWKGGDLEVISFSIKGDIPETYTSGAFNKWEYELAVLGNVRGWVGVKDEQLRVSGSHGETELIERLEDERILKSRDGRILSHIVDDRSALEFEIPDWEGTLIRRYFLLFRFYRLIPPLMRQWNSASAASFLNEYGDNLGSWLMTLQTRHLQAFSQVREVTKDVFPDIADLFTSPTHQSTVYLSSRERHLSRPIDVWAMSEGELAFIALLSLLFAPDELGASLYCVEEIENHLHPKLLETIFELHNQVMREKGENAGQVILTTHSPQVVDLCGLDDLAVVERREGATVATRPKNKAHLRELLTRKEIGLGTLFFSGALSGAE